MREEAAPAGDRSTAEVVCVGILVADVVGQPIDAYPDRGKLGLVPRMELHPGGCAANTGIALGKLGIFLHWS